MADVAVTIPELRNVGNVARGFESAANDAKSAVGIAGNAYWGARLSTFQSGWALDSLVQNWAGKYSAQGTTLRTVGDSIVSTANIYAHHDHLSADPFRNLPIPPGAR